MSNHIWLRIVDPILVHGGRNNIECVGTTMQFALPVRLLSMGVFIFNK
jgi:hypothetical protein